MKKTNLLSFLLVLALCAAIISGCAAQDAQSPAPAPSAEAPAAPTAAPTPTPEPTPEPMTASVVAKQMADATAGKSMSKTKGTTGFEMGITAQGETLELSTETVNEVVTVLDPYASYTKTEVTSSFAGEETTEITEVYMVMEEDALVGYTYIESADQWIKMPLDLDVDELITQTPEYNWMTEKPEDELVLDEGTKNVDGREAYVLRVTLTGEEMQKAVGNSDALDSLTSLGMEEVDISMLSVDTVFYVDTESFLPIAFDMEINGLSDLMTEVMTASMGQGAEGLDLEFDVSPLRLSYSDIEYGPVEVPAVPEEAIQNAIEAEN